MKRVTISLIAALVGASGWQMHAQQGGGATSPALYDWTTDGGDAARTGWNRDETVLTPENVGNLKLLWKTQTGNQPRALHALMPTLVIGELQTPSGVKQMAIVSGISDNLYGIDASDGTILWHRHWDYLEPEGGGRGGGGGAAPQGGQAGTGTPNDACYPPLPPGVEPEPGPGADLGFLGPGGSSDVPAIGEADGQGRRPVYFVTGDGMLRTLNAATGEDLWPAFCFTTGKGWALNIVDGVVWMPHRRDISATLLDDPDHNVMTVNSGSGGMWGRRGAAVDSTGVAWTTTGDGQYNPANRQYANSVMGVKVENNTLQMVDYFTPTNWNWLYKRDLDPNNTPTIFTYQGRELLAASGKECRIYLIDPREAGGEDHQTPLYKTPLFCNEEVDFQDRGSWGALSSWQDGSGTQWVLAPFWGEVHSQFRAPIMNDPMPVEGGVAAFKVTGPVDSPVLEPAWVSRDMLRGEPVIIANGVVYGYGSGEETRQSWELSASLYMTANYRAARGTHATIYAMDAQTGEELWSSGDTITSWNHFSGITVANGRVYLGTYDGTLWCFGLDETP